MDQAAFGKDRVQVCRHMLQVGSSLLPPPSQAVMLENSTFQMTKKSSS